MRLTRRARQVRSGLATALASLGLALLVPTGAVAQVELLTPDTPSPPTQYSAPNYEGASADGSTVFFSSAEPVTGVTTGPSGALYARSNGVTRLITRGADSPTEVPPDFAGSSADGSNAYFYLPNFLNSFSWTNVLDRWNGDDVQAISDGAGFICADATGSRVVFLSYRALVPDDRDSRGDLYVLSSSGLRLLTPGASDADGAWDVNPWGHSSDCSTVFFNTFEQLVAADGDSRADIYGVGVDTADVRLESTGPTAHNAPEDAGYSGSSADGTHVYFTTAEQLTSDDTDAATSLYERAGDTTRLVTRAGDATFKGASADGSHVFFESAASLSADDKDALVDVYDANMHGTQLVSTGHSPTGQADATFAGASADGSHVIFSTAARVEPSDTNDYVDLYDRHAGSTTLISSSAAGDLPDGPRLDAISPTGDRIVFSTARPLTSDDTDGRVDIYVSSNGSRRLLSTGPAGGNGDSYSIFLGASASASRIFFGTAEGLVPSDVDGQWDIYAADVPTLSPPADNPTGTPGDGGKSGDGTTHPTTKPRCVVPAIKNVTLVRARQRLATHHCRLGRVRLRASARRVGAAKRRVANQSPHAGAVRPERARVSVWLAAGNRL